MSTQTITIGETTFDHVNYDRDADVLYLSVDPPHPAEHTFGTPEGHAVRMDGSNRIIGITLVNAGALLNQGDLEVTLPQVVDVRRSDLEAAFAG
jgi:uncharacterized protein YuzE